MVRDDGENGLWISHPDVPAQMNRITRSDFRDNWRLFKTESQQGVEDVGASFDNRKSPDVILNINDSVNTPKETKEDMEPRTEPTDREAMKNEILGAEVTDVTSDGDPVGGSEEPMETLEEDRGADPEAVDEMIEANEGRAQSFEANESADDKPRKSRSKKA